MMTKAKFDNSWKIAESFTDPSNSDLLQSLTNGCNLLRINFSQNYDPSNITELFSDVYLDMITIYAQGQTASVKEVAKLREKENEVLLFSFENRNYEDELLSFLTACKSFLRQDQSKHEIYITFQSNMEFLQNICKIKAIRILWAHMLASFRMEQRPLEILCEVSDFDDNRSMEEDYIFSSIQMLSSVIAGADSIEIKTSKKSKYSKEFRSRISRNLHHLGSLEGKLNLVHEPLEGSYFVESESNNFAKTAWNKFTV